MSNEHVAALIRQIRVAEMQMTQQEFARTLRVSQPTISNWERGRNLPGAVSYDRIIALTHDDAELPDIERRKGPQNHV